MTPSRTASLFDDDPDQVLSLVEALANSKPITKAQLSFQRLVAKIERKREQLKQWRAYELRFHKRLAAEMAPLQVQLRVGQRQMVDLIDELLSQPAPGQRLGRVQRAKLRHLLLNLVAGLLDDGADEALEALHDKYGEISHAQIRQSELDLAHALLGDIVGLEVGDDHGASSAEELLRHAQRKMQERAAEQARLAQERQDAGPAKRSEASAAKAEAAQAKREQAAREVGQSVRDVYRKLASALHPDRELDAPARQRKTLQMQRVNQAYEANDLLTLLSLQLEIEQIDAALLSSVPPQRLAHYNHVLREQVAELDDELQHCVGSFRHGMVRGWGSAMTPASVDQQLSADIAELRAAVRELQEDLVAFRDSSRLREALAHRALEADADDPFGLGSLPELQDVFEAPAPRGKKHRPS
jgi:hypothetical protein